MNSKRTLTILTLITLLAGLFGMPSASAAPQATTYTVNSDTSADDANIGDGICSVAGSGNCTLRAAIQEANAHTGYQTINFASMFQGTHQIDGCSLPIITTDNLTIDASNWWDNGYDRPGVEIIGSNCDLITIAAGGTTLLGLFFGGGGTTVGVRVVSGGLNSIGGWGSGQRNVFLTGKYGVHLETGTGTLNYVVNNYFGTVDGQSLPGGGMGEIGILAQSTYGVISSNLIVGQSSSGIQLGIYGGSNVVNDNIIGLDKYKGSALANGIGITIGSSDYNVIGSGNVIAGNTNTGVYLHHADDCLIYDNHIGYMWSGGIGNGGNGIHIHASANTQINDGNSISNNGGYGVYAHGSTGIEIKDNGIGGSSQDGVYFENSDGQIGGAGSNGRNFISSNVGHGVHISGTAVVTVTGNYVGLDGVGGFDAGNGGHGILLENGVHSSYIGGTGVGEGNWIAYNDQYGILMRGSDTRYNYVLGNVIGAPIYWNWEAPNGLHGIGIYDGAHDNYIGWDGTPSGGNTILSSGWSGVAIVGGSNYNAVLDNYIGTNGAGINWGNAYYGVVVVNSSHTSIKSNEIAYNGTYNGSDGGQAGVRIDGATAVNNMIAGNSIHDNDGPGIELVSGGNHSLAAPIIDSATCGSVQGHTSPPCLNCQVEIFSDDNGEGRVYEGYFITDPSGNFNWGGTLNGPNATATVMIPGGLPDTSEFSTPVNVGICNYAPTAAFTVNPTKGYTSTIFSFDASGSSDPEDATSALQVRWDWDNNGFFDTGWSATKTASFSYTSVGTYTVRLEVMDTHGLTGSTTRQVVVTPEYRTYLPLVVRN